MQQVTDEELAEQASRSTDVPDEGPRHGRELVRRATEDESTTAKGQCPPVEYRLPFAHGGRYYDVAWT